MCGNTGPNFTEVNHPWAGTYIPNTQSTGPVVKVYKSGEQVKMTVKVKF